MVSSVVRRLHYQSPSSIAPNGSSQQFFSSNGSLPTDPSCSSVGISNPLIKIIYTTSLNDLSSPSQENQQLLLNSYASCRRLLDYLKQTVGISQEEVIDVMDAEGKVKELNIHSDDHATQHLTARNTYYLLKIDVDTQNGEKRYIPSFNLDLIDQKVATVLTNSLNALNKSTKQPKRLAGPSRQTTAAPASSATPQAKAKRTTNRKQN